MLNKGGKTLNILNQLNQDTLSILSLNQDNLNILGNYSTMIVLVIGLVINTFSTMVFWAHLEEISESWLWKMWQAKR